jgi:hypothetical protein
VANDDRLSYHCDVKRMFKTDDGKVLRWVKEWVEGVSKDAAIRCTYCHGGVRIHKASADGLFKRHVEHLQGTGTNDCMAGAYFLGTHKMSDQPIE